MSASPSNQLNESVPAVPNNIPSADIRLLLTLLMLVWGTLAFGQAWSGILDPSRAIDWTKAGVAGGIPTITTQCGSTIAPYGSSGAYASPSTINAAIQSCPSRAYPTL